MESFVSSNTVSYWLRLALILFLECSYISDTTSKVILIIEGSDAYYILLLKLFLSLSKWTLLKRNSLQI